jgi:regulator of sirC expression with transglutaminase-like and TPR domain
MSQNPQTHYDVGFAYAELGLRAEAVVELERALELDPLHPRAAAARLLIARLRDQRYLLSKPVVGGDEKPS